MFTVNPIDSGKLAHSVQHDYLQAAAQRRLFAHNKTAQSKRFSLSNLFSKRPAVRSAKPAIASAR